MLLTVFAIIIIMWIYTLQTKIDLLQDQLNRLHNIIDNTSSSKEDSTEEEFVEPQEIPELVASIETEKEHIDHKRQNQSKIIEWIKDYFTHGNILVRVGGVVLFFGLAFLVKYVAEHSIISIEVRLISISIIAVALTILGWLLRRREGGYGLILQGLGISLLYLVIYSSAKFFSMLTIDSAFILMFGVVIIGSVLAVLEDALPLALFATAGGFLVPILTSNGEGSHIVLFSYYAQLNVGIFLMSWYRSWRILNLSGFVFTFIIATLWGVLRYEYEMFDTTEPFLILYFFMYLGISILFTLRHPFRPRNFVDATLVFGLPLVAFPLQLELVQYIEYADAYSALSLGVVYTILWLLLKKGERSDLLAKSFLALGVVFYTIAISYYFDARVASSLWALESAAIIWISLKQSQTYSRYFGEFLLLLAIFTYPISTIFSSSDIAFLNAEYLGYIIITIATIISSYLLDRHRSQLSTLDSQAPIIYLTLATLIWIGAGSEEISRFHIIHSSGMLIYLTVGTIIIATIPKLIKWQMFLDTLQLYLPIGIFFIYGILTNYHYISPLSGVGLYGIIGFFLLHYMLLWYIGKEWRYSDYLHISSLWIITLLAMEEISYRVELWRDTDSWVVGVVALAPLLIATAILSINGFSKLYKYIGVGGLVMILFIWEWVSFALPADLTPLEYIPIINPLDMLEILSLAMIGYWIYRYSDQFSNSIRTILGSSMAILLTLLNSVILARAIHHFKDIAYHPHALYDSLFFQVGLSILWSLLAIALMLLSKRYKSHPLWISGFALLIIVVIKLFLVELSSSGTIERIISFIVVGTLLLLVGYFAPLPPTNQEEQGSSQVFA